MSALRAETDDRGRPPAGAASNVSGNGDELSLRQTVDHFVLRLLTDCLNEQTRRYWLKRADDFEQAKPNLADYRGHANPEQLRAQWHRLDAIAQACRNRAHVSPLEDIAPEVDAVMQEAS